MLLGVALGVHGEARRLEGDVVAAEAGLRTALELPEATITRSLALRGLLEALVEQGEVATAVDELRRAGLTATLPDATPTVGLLYARGRVRMSGAVAVARPGTEKLVRAGGRPRRGRRRGARSLTPAERRVAEGMTNREAAETLVVSEKTIETHLAAAFRKLGIGARGQLGGALARSGDDLPASAPEPSPRRGATAARSAAESGEIPGDLRVDAAPRPL
jgi:DNA-binding CsgD family transcriptional regulator